MLDISVIIPTYNRKALLDRCLASVYRQKHLVKDIIVVDDASTDGTDEWMRNHYPDCIYHKLNENLGVCCARNTGLSLCRSEYALFLDSDDELKEGALDTVYEEMEKFLAGNDRYSIYLFLRSQARLKEEGIFVLHAEHVIKHYVVGNTTEVIDIQRFKENHYKYPERISRIGGEHLLWLEISRKEGIPVFNKIITIEHDDANNRLTAPYSLLKNAKYHALLQELIIVGYKDLYLKYDQNEYLKRLNACSVYWKLSGRAKKALHWAVQSLKLRFCLKSMITFIFSILPMVLAKHVFIRWRKATL